MKKFINNKKYISTFNNKNHNNSQQPPPGSPATAIQFRKKIQQTFKSYYQEKKLKNNKQISSIVPLDQYKLNILSDKSFKEALFVIVLYI